MIIKIKPRFRQFGKFVKTYKSAKTGKYEKEIAKQYLKNGGKYYENTLLKISLDFYFKPNKSDAKKVKGEKITNELKYPPNFPNVGDLVATILDGLKGVAYKDDSQIVIIQSNKTFAPKEYVELRIYELKKTNNYFGYSNCSAYYQVVH